MEVHDSLVREVQKCLELIRKLNAAEDDEQSTEGGKKSQPFPGLKKVEKHLDDVLKWSRKARNIFSQDPPKAPNVLENTAEQHMGDFYIKSELAEKAAIKELRAHNVTKLAAGTNGGTYCICRSPVKGAAHKCALCYGWFHGTCIVLTAINDTFLCPYCRSTKGPALAFMFPLLAEDPSVKLPNGDSVVSSADKALRFREVFKLIIRVGEVRDVLEQIAKNKASGATAQFEEDVEELHLEGLLLELQLDHVEELRKIWMTVVDEDAASGTSQAPKKPEPEVCSAKICLKPKDDIIDWVQCDGSCDLWFHMTCVHLKKQEVGNNDLFFCFDCRMDMIGFRKKVSTSRKEKS